MKCFQVSLECKKKEKNATALRNILSTKLASLSCSQFLCVDFGIKITFGP